MEFLKVKWIFINVDFMVLICLLIYFFWILLEKIFLIINKIIIINRFRNMIFVFGFFFIFFCYFG